MSSLKRHEGYLQIDHRNSPGVPAEVLAQFGLPPAAGMGLFEAAVLTCSHCQKQLLKSPTRTRERAYCPKCDHYLCDECGARRAASGGECRTFKQVTDEIREAAAKAEPQEPPAIIIAKA